MPAEENITPAVEETEQEGGIDAEAIAEAIQGLLDNGLSAEQVLDVVGKAVEGGDLPPEAIEIAKKLLEADEEEGKRLFGLEE